MTPTIFSNTNTQSCQNDDLLNSLHTDLSIQPVITMKEGNKRLELKPTESFQSEHSCKILTCGFFLLEHNLFPCLTKHDDKDRQASGISFMPQRNASKNIFLSNRFNGLSQDDDCEIVNDDQIKHSGGIPEHDQNNIHSVPVTVIKQNNPVNQLEPNRRPNPVITKNPEREKCFKRSDGNANATQNSIRILSESIPKGIRVREFNSYVKNGYARFKSFPCASAAHLNYYVNPTLEEEKPNIVIIHIGINNLLSKDLSVASNSEIVSEIIKIIKRR